MTTTKENLSTRTHDANGTKRSIYERVMSDPVSRHAYFNTTQGMLRGNPRCSDTEKILKVLDDHGIVYLYAPSSNRPRPTFYSHGEISIGLAEITATAKRLAEST